MSDAPMITATASASASASSGASVTATSSAKPPSTKPYIVQGKDTLQGIALKHSMTVSQIRTLNRMAFGSDIFPGQVIRVYKRPAGTVGSPKSTSSDEADSPSDEVAPTFSGLQRQQKEQQQHQQQQAAQQYSEMTASAFLDSIKSRGPPVAVPVGQSDGVDHDATEEWEIVRANVVGANEYTSARVEPAGSNPSADATDGVARSNSRARSNSIETRDKEKVQRKNRSHDDLDLVAIGKSDAVAGGSASAAASPASSTSSLPVMHVKARHVAPATLKFEKIPKVLLLQGPCLLSDDQRQYIEHALPVRFKRHDWMCLFSSREDGVSLMNMYRRLEDIGPVIVVVQDVYGSIFGGFSAEPVHVSSRYYGSGEAFVFTGTAAQRKPSSPRSGSMDADSTEDAPSAANSTTAAKSEPDDPYIEIYRWSKQNSFFVLSDTHHLAFGGGHSWAFSVNELLSEGSTGPCDTFNSPAMTRNGNENYHIFAVQVFAVYRPQVAAHREFFETTTQQRVYRKFYTR